MPAPTQDTATSTPTRQQARASARHRSRLSQARRAGYLATTAGCCGLATTANAEIVPINISAFAGPNGGLPVNSFTTLTNWAGPGTGMLYPYTGRASPCNGNRFRGFVQRIPVSVRGQSNPAGGPPVLSDQLQ